MEGPNHQPLCCAQPMFGTAGKQAWWLTLVVPPVQGAISGTAFAQSLVAHVRVARIDAFLDRVDALPQELGRAQVQIDSPPRQHLLKHLLFRCGRQHAQH